MSHLPKHWGRRSRRFSGLQIIESRQYRGVRLSVRRCLTGQTFKREDYSVLVESTDHQNTTILRGFRTPAAALEAGQHRVDFESQLGAWRKRRRRASSPRR